MKAYYDSPFGCIEFVFDGDQLAELNIAREKPALLDTLSNLQKNAVQQLTEYFDGVRKDFEISIVFNTGTEFEQNVWTALLDIPYGKSCSYSDVAYKIGKDRKASQAVGRAVGRNPIAIIVPCHRVIGKNGKLTGFASGIDRKIFLLNLERQRTIGAQGSLF